MRVVMKRRRKSRKNKSMMNLLKRRKHAVKEKIRLRKRYEERVRRGGG